MTQDEAVWADVRRLAAEKMARVRARRDAPFVADSPGVEGGQGREAKDVEFSARVVAWCALVVGALFLAGMAMAAMR